MWSFIGLPSFFFFFFFKTVRGVWCRVASSDQVLPCHVFRVRARAGVRRGSIRDPEPPGSLPEVNTQERTYLHS